MRTNDVLQGIATLPQIEKAWIEHVLRLTKGRRYLSAQILGISRQSLSFKLTKLRIDWKRFAEQGQESPG